MGRIVVLDRNMVNMIAAGEVIERPASVVKELLENSIDAGATKITVTIEDGGKKLISIADDGCGMDSDDLANAFEAHATSKIKSTSDLNAISTLGFRGEALASIASVAQVKAVSRTSDSPGGNCIEIDCGDKTPIAPCSADYGTTIHIRDLFYKLPARRKFLKTATTEMGHITEFFTRIALANPNLDMTLIRNGKEVHKLPANQQITQRIGELFSAEISENLIETRSKEKGLEIFALLGKPQISRANSKMQYVFLNSRFIRDKFISHAIKEAYRGCLEPNRFPVVFLFIKMPCEDYDVNVHPTKTEVRFYNSNLVHSQILGAIREKLLAADFQMPANLSQTNQGRQEVVDAMADFFKKHRPVTSQQQFSFPSSSNKRYSYAHTQAAPLPSSAGLLTEKKFIQIHDSFIVCETDDGFVIIDQHALHERILYDQMKKRVQTGRLESQKLLIPESFELTETEAVAIEANQYLLKKLGIELTNFGPRTMALHSLPSLLANASPADFIRDLIDLLTNSQIALDAERLLDEVLDMAACKAAIKAGQSLSESEIDQLLTDRENVELAGRCPHGRPSIIEFSTCDLEKQFKRT